VLADDDVLLREGLASLLDRSGFDVAARQGTGQNCSPWSVSVHPELAIIDIRMPPAHATEGLQAARVIREELPGTGDHRAVRPCRGGRGDGATGRRGAHRLSAEEPGHRCGGVHRDGRADHAGASVVDPSLVQELVRARRRREPLDVLSPGEREVLALMAEGASNAGIARRIFVARARSRSTFAASDQLDLPESETEHRRVQAVLRFLEAR